MRQGWVKPEDIQVVFLHGPDDIDGVREPLTRILLESRGSIEPDWFEWLATHWDAIVMFYVKGEPVGFVQIDWYKDSAHLHGRLLPGVKIKGLTYYATIRMLDHIFFVRNRKQCRICVPFDNPAVKGFARLWQFKKTHLTKDGTMYLLERKDYRKRRLLMNV